MPESSEISNLGSAVAVTWPSLVVWGFIAARWLKGQPALPMEPRDPPGWHPGGVAFAFPVVIAVHLLAQAMLTYPETPDISSVRSESIRMAAEAIALVALLALGAPLRAADFGVCRRRIPSDVGIGVLGFLAALLPVLIVNLTVNALGWRAEGARHQFFDILFAAEGYATLLWIALAVVVLAPLTEELFYRVILQGWLETQISPRAAWLFVALMFSIVHSEPGRPDALPILPLALILGYVYQRRHSYVAVVVTHSLFNAINLALALWQEQGAPG